MKQYFSLGSLLIDYRIDRSMSQLDLSLLTNVDVRTIQRWEKNITLIKPDKEKEIAEATLLPYQLIRNLNTSAPIPTYYDFRIRKYSLTELNNELPDASWLDGRVKEFSKRTRTIKPDTDMVILKQDLLLQKNNQDPISRNLLVRAVELLPELNLIIKDDFGNYSGHSIALPLKKEAYDLLVNRQMPVSDLNSAHLINYKNSELPVFLNYDITADCNDNVYYLSHEYLKFFKDFTREYIYCAYTMRYDSYRLNEQLDMKLIWEDQVQKDALGLKYFPRFYSGNFNKYFSSLT